MEDGKMMRGFQFVKKFFPRARISDEPSEEAVKALTFIGDLDAPLQSDIVVAFDRFGAGIWDGEEID